MKKVIIFFVTMFSVCQIGLAQSLDSLARTALTYAAQNDISSLRPLYAKYSQTLPHHVRLYCAMTLSGNDGEYDHMITYIDSLKKWYPQQIKTRTQLSLSEIKASGLRHLGKYDDLYTFCNNEIRFFKKKGMRDSQLKELFFQKGKAEKLKGNTPQKLLLQYLDLSKLPEVDSLFKTCQNALDEPTSLQCELFLAHAYHQSENILHFSDLLLQKYTSQLDIEEYSQCIKTRADELIHLGQWKELNELAEFVIGKDKGYTSPVPLYKLLSNTFIDKPAYEVIRPVNSRSIITSYEWPILFEGKVNGTLTDEFTISTAQPYTLLSEEFAKQCHAEILPDTILLTTTYGVLEVNPAWLNNITIGDIQFKNVYVYVLHESSSPFPRFSCTLGLNEFLEMKSVSFMPEKLTFPTYPTAGGTVVPKGHIYISKDNALCISGWHNTQRVHFICDPSYPNNILYKGVWCTSKQKDAVPIFIDNQEYEINRPQTIDNPSTLCHGILGTPFLKNYSFLNLDFRQMHITASDILGYQPSRGNFGYSTDKHYLRRNLKALEIGNTDPQEIPFLHTLVTMGINKPQETGALCETMRTSHNDFYNLHTEIESLCSSGLFKKAYSVISDTLKQATQDQSIQHEDLEKLKDLQRYVSLFKNVQPIEFKFGSRQFSFPAGNSYVRISKKKAFAEFDIFQPLTEISQSYVKKYKVKVLGIHQNKTYGIIPEITFGEIVFKNIPCVIRQGSKKELKKFLDKGKGIRIGWNVLRHFSEIAMTKDQITLYPKDSSGTSLSAAQLYYDNGLWYMETEASGTYPTYQLTSGNQNTGIAQNIQLADLNIPADDITPKAIKEKDKIQGCLSLGYLLDKRGTVIVNAQKMQISFR